MAKMIKCKTCGADIAKSAKICPHCGAKQKKNTAASIVLAVICAALFVSWIANSNTSADSEMQTNSGEKEPVKTEENETIAKTNPDLSSKEDKTATQDTPDSEPPISEDKTVGFGGTISGECFDISIVDAKWTDSLDISMGSVSIQNTPQKDGNKLLCLIFNAKNTTDDTENLGMFNAYVDKQAVLPTSVLGKVDDAMIFVGAVASGMEMKAYQVWELPENWEEFQLNYFEATGPECSQYFIIHPEDIDKT